jgi:hypothetical protein
MAHFLKTDNRNYEVLSMSRAEAAALVRDITHHLLFTSGTAPSLQINERTCRTYQLLFQVDPKQVTEPGITTLNDDRDPVFLKGPYEEEP